MAGAARVPRIVRERRVRRSIGKLLVCFAEALCPGVFLSTPYAELQFFSVKWLTV
jgi:hypothetical protein